MDDSPLNFSTLDIRPYRYLCQAVRTMIHQLMEVSHANRDWLPLVSGKVDTSSARWKMVRINTHHHTLYKCTTNMEILGSQSIALISSKLVWTSADNSDKPSFLTCRASTIEWFIEKPNYIMDIRAYKTLSAINKLLYTLSKSHANPSYSFARHRMNTGQTLKKTKS